MGFIANQVNGGLTINNNTMGDPDAIEIGLNTINGGLPAPETYGTRIATSLPMTDREVSRPTASTGPRRIRTT